MSKKCLNKIVNNDCGLCIMFSECVYRMFFTISRTRAFADAVAAVEKINLDDDYPINIITKVIAAIEKLKEQ